MFEEGKSMMQHQVTKNVLCVNSESSYSAMSRELRQGCPPSPKVIVAEFSLATHLNRQNQPGTLCAISTFSVDPNKTVNLEYFL